MNTERIEKLCEQLQDSDTADGRYKLYKTSQKFNGSPSPRAA